MGEAIHFSCQAILRAALEDIGGTELLLSDVPTGNGFRKRVSFDVPNVDGFGLMENITAVGVAAATEADAEERACVAAVRVLWKDYKYIVLDYSLLRLWRCAERYSRLVEKLEHSKTIFEDVSLTAFEAFDSVQSGPSFFLQRIGYMRNIGVDETIIGAAVSCIGFLQMMHVRGSSVRQEAMNRLHGMNNHEGIAGLLATAGFQVPINDPGYTKIIGGVKMILNRVSEALGYNAHSFRILTRGDLQKCVLDFFARGVNGDCVYRAIGEACSSTSEALETANYNALLAFSVNRGVTINDINVHGYIFVRDWVRHVAADAEAMGEIGSSVCSYLNSTQRGMKLMSRTYGGVLRNHPCGEELANKLEEFAAEIGQCLTTIVEPVRLINEDAAVSLLPF